MQAGGMGREHGLRQEPVEAWPAPSAGTAGLVAPGPAPEPCDAECNQGGWPVRPPDYSIDASSMDTPWPVSMPRKNHTSAPDKPIAQTSILNSI